MCALGIVLIQKRRNDGIDAPTSVDHVRSAWVRSGRHAHRLAHQISRFFADLEQAQSADFYARVGSLGRIFVGIEAKAFSLLS